MRAIDADKLKPDCMTKDGRFAISQSQIANAKPIQTSTDAVSRQAVLEPYKYLKDDDVIAVWLIKKNIEQQKSVTPTRPKGQWICIDDYHIGKFKCSVCQTEGFPNTVMYEPIWNYCPNCGADMRGEA